MFLMAKLLINNFNAFLILIKHFAESFLCPYTESVILPYCLKKLHFRSSIEHSFIFQFVPFPVHNKFFRLGFKIVICFCHHFGGNLTIYWSWCSLHKTGWAMYKGFRWVGLEVYPYASLGLTLAWHDWNLI